MSWYKIATDLGSLIGGIFALIAGVLAYAAGRRQARVTRQVADEQIKAAAEKDRLQAQSIAVAIFPGLINMQVDHERASTIIRDEFPKIMSAPNPINRFIELAPSLRISIPPLLDRNLDRLYLLGGAGHELLQLVSFTLEYNDMVNTLRRHVSDGVIVLKPREICGSSVPSP